MPGAAAGPAVLACAPFLIYKEWLYQLMFRGKWEMRISHSSNRDCRVAPRKANDLVKFCAGSHWCNFKIRRVHDNSWTRPSEALLALGWQHVVPFAQSFREALHYLWKSLDRKLRFNSAADWDTNMVDQGKVVVWEGRCTQGLYDNFEYAFTAKPSTNILL
jgi:hypothetical protein